MTATFFKVYFSVQCYILILCWKSARGELSHCVDHLSKRLCDEIDAESTICPPACAAWLSEMPSGCHGLLESRCNHSERSSMHRLNSLCGTSFQCTGPTSFQAASGGVAEGVLPTHPEEDSPGLMEDGLLLSGNFTCDEGDGFQWLTLNPEAASQSGVLSSANDGAGQAIVSSCAEVDPSPGGPECCSITAPGVFPWWEYDMGERMTVKGIQFTAPTSGCYTQEISDGADPLSYSRFNAITYVGSTSPRGVMATAEYEELLAGAHGDASLVQPYVMQTVAAKGTSCSVVQAAVCAEGAQVLLPTITACRTEPAPLDMSGRYITSFLATPDGEQSMGLCGIEVCAKKADS